MKQNQTQTKTKAPASSLERMVRQWHSCRAAAYELKLKVQEARCELLTKAEREYRFSYYTDRLHDAVCHRVQISSALEYHRARATPPNDPSSATRP